MPRDERHTETIPYGTLGIIPLASCTEMGKKVDEYLVKWREQRQNENTSTLNFAGYKRDSYIVNAKTPRFGSGEGKGVLVDSVRVMTYILCLMSATTALNILFAVSRTICLLMITMLTSRELLLLQVVRQEELM